MNIKPNPIMELQDTEGLENRMGYWMKKRSLDEKIKEAKRFAKEFDEDESPLIEVYAKIGEIKPKKGKP